MVTEIPAIKWMVRSTMSKSDTLPNENGNFLSI